MTSELFISDCNLIRMISHRPHHLFVHMYLSEDNEDTYTRRYNTNNFIQGTDPPMLHYAR